MQWPSPAEYTTAVRNYPHVSLQDPKLRDGRVRMGRDNFVLSYAGGFSIVFPIDVASKTFALRCWTKGIDDAQIRYEKISDYLQQESLPWFVDFKYEPEGIMVMGEKYPITRMEWVEGVSLRESIEQNLQSPHIFKVIADDFQEMVAILHKHGVSHGDLQDGNILIKQNGVDVKLKLIDYDGLFVPTLQGQPEQIVGLPEYQHPTRMVSGGQANEKVDYFSELVIYLSFLSLAEKPELWNRVKDKTERGLLFSKEDFENSDQSDIFQELEQLSPDVQQLAATLKDFCAKTSIDQLAPLEAILPKLDANTYCDQGESFLNNECYDEALAEFRKAIALDPRYERAHYGIGLAYLHKEQYTDAINAFQQAIRQNSNYKEAYHGLGLAYFRSGDSSNATVAADAALNIDSRYQPAHQLLRAIRSSAAIYVTPSSITNPTSTSASPTSHSTTLQSTSSNPVLNIWQPLAALLSLGLVICLVVLAERINKRNVVLREVDKLKRQQGNENSEIQQLTSALQALEKQKETLSSENRKLKSQLAEKDTEIQRLTSRVSPLQLPTRNSMELAEMVLIPAGNFRMGSNDAAAYTDEKPVHTVYINAFYIDKYEVTNEEYKRFIDANPWWRKDRILGKYHDGDYLMHWIGNRYPYGKGNHPVIWVSWYAAMAYAQWKGKRLPTEAEWEKAARGGLVNNYLSGSLVNSQTANYDRNVGSTTRVGNYQANSYGLYDMVGNVSEWCLDAYSSSFYANSARRNPVAGGSIYNIVRDFKNLNPSRVLRGGSWSSNANYVRIAYRSSDSPVRTSNTIGFRCVKPLAP